MAAGGLAAALAVAPALAKEKVRAPAQPTCARTSYPGDPVCDVGDPGSELPMPGSRSVRTEAPGGLRVNDNVTIRGRSDFNADRNGPIQFNNPNPHPGLQDVNGGGAVNYKF